MSVKRDCRCSRVQHQHGTMRAYQTDRCRCWSCRVAHANAARAYRGGGHWLEAFVDGTGTRRRLRALSAAGVTNQQIADHIGVSRGWVEKIRNRRVGQVTHASAAAVRGAYNQLWDKSRGDVNSRRCSTQAAAKGWLPPLAWDDDTIDDPDARPSRGPAVRVDEVKVQRAVDGEPVRLTIHERHAARHILETRGLGADAIAKRLSQSARTVVRHRARARTAA